ncbi:hypothetical protein LIER_12486 [Lithospermum erythrorhizon]|uniref:Uncharacterized protein n=1 Tax=Lithospermum erythrorhizon TaxID=34254 RepID=A0AAV3PW30_LITER
MLTILYFLHSANATVLLARKNYQDGNSSSKSDPVDIHNDIESRKQGGAAGGSLSSGLNRSTGGSKMDQTIIYVVRPLTHSRTQITTLNKAYGDEGIHSRVTIRDLVEDHIIHIVTNLSARGKKGHERKEWLNILCDWMVKTFNEKRLELLLKAN